MTIRNFQSYKPLLGQGVYVDDTALIIGDVEIGEQSSIWPMAVVRGDVNSIRIGKFTSIQDGSVLHVTHRSANNPEGHPLQIGNYVTVGHKVTLHGCQIDDYCLIGMGAIVMDGAHVQENVMIGAGSLVPPGKVLESGHLWMGAPVKKIRPLDPQETAFFAYSAESYQKLKQQYSGL